ncbi:hypothetical protein AB0K16_25875 [Nonomuraea jabiensis]|uniref:hypothetical protein n=1 Tax=Nonomuraea jabiensis TaxID=882448 RepID=UPI003433557E
MVARSADGERFETLTTVTREEMDAESLERPSLVRLPGNPKTGVKDTVIVRRDGVWHLWASCHPLADPDEADQMVTDYAPASTA